MINSEDLPTYFESNDPQADVRYDNKQLKAELESLRQENARLRERMNQLTDDYEGTIKRLREALEQLSNACKPLEHVEWCNLTKADEQTLNEVEHQRLLARAVLNPPKS